MNKIILKISIVILIFANTSLIHAQTFNVTDFVQPKSRQKTIATVDNYEDNLLVTITTEIVSNQKIISGKIIDKKTVEGIPGASIIETGTSNGTVSDTEGGFKLSTTSSNPVLTISFVGYARTNVEAPTVGNTKSVDISGVNLETVPVTYTSDNNSLTSLSGLFVANFGQESMIQPNIMLSQGYAIGRHGIELRILGFQSNRDTVQQINGLHLIKPEISKLNFRLTGDVKPFKNHTNFSLNPEINIYRQQLNQRNELNQEIQSDDITSLLCKFTAGYNIAEGLNLYASGVYYSVFEGIQNYENRFGEGANQNFLNFELSGQFAVKEGGLQGTYIQAQFNLNSENYKNLLETRDLGVFMIRLGFNKALSIR